jgi:hypothetical protein
MGWALLKPPFKSNKVRSALSAVCEFALADFTVATKVRIDGQHRSILNS